MKGVSLVGNCVDARNSREQRWPFPAQEIQDPGFPEGFEYADDSDNPNRAPDDVPSSRLAYPLLGHGA